MSGVVSDGLPDAIIRGLPPETAMYHSPQLFRSDKGAIGAVGVLMMLLDAISECWYNERKSGG